MDSLDFYGSRPTSEAQRPTFTVHGRLPMSNYRLLSFMTDFRGATTDFEAHDQLSTPHDRLFMPNDQLWVPNDRLLRFTTDFRRLRNNPTHPHNFRQQKMRIAEAMRIFLLINHRTHLNHLFSHIVLMLVQRSLFLYRRSYRHRL